MEIVARHIQIGEKLFRLDIRTHAISALVRRMKSIQSMRDAENYIVKFITKPQIVNVVRLTPITKFAAVLDEESMLCLFIRVNTKSIFVGTALMKRQEPIIANADDRKFVIRKNGELLQLDINEDNEFFVRKDKWKNTQCRAAKTG